MREGLEVCVTCAAMPVQLDSRVVLIGDAGENYGDTDNLRAVSRVAAQAPERTVVVFLGDNVYPRGIPPVSADEAPDPLVLAEREDAEEILRTQLATVERTGAEGVFIPGNHDWALGDVAGLARVEAQEDFLDAAAQDAGRVRLLPRNGCPGPVILDRGDTVRIIVVDTVWLLIGDSRPRGEENCFWGTEEDPQPLDPADRSRFLQVLQEAVAGAEGRHVLFAAHHPFKTRGPHGGYFTVQEFLFPLTLVKKWLYIPLPMLYPLVRYQVVRSDEDLIGSRNEILRERLELVLSEAEHLPVVTAGGHEHSLQVFDDTRFPIYHLVSGAGSKTTPVGKRDDTLFKDRNVGFMVLDYFVDGRASLAVVEPTGEDSHETVFSMWIDDGQE